jgi:hypothetical protein
MDETKQGDDGIAPVSAQGCRLPAEKLNSTCFCSSLDQGALRHALADELGGDTLYALVEQRCPYLFSARPVFVSESQATRIDELVRAVESVVAMPAYRQRVLAHAPDIAQHDPGGARGVFFGYDFHPRGDRLGLIEINTNAGGAMLNAAMARAHRVCCTDDRLLERAVVSGAVFEDAILAMFQSEWTLSGRGRPLNRIAIVDLAPTEQYLYPEFLLFQRLFGRAGIDAVIADPAQLSFRDGSLWMGDLQIDLVYNRLTDFMLETPACQALRQAYLEHAAVVTPHPQAHALYANKRNLVILSNADLLAELSVPRHVADILLANIPRTEVVGSENAERLWSERRGLFFKPMAGYGSRAAYRGDKLTKRVWQDILAGDYIAQAIVAPGERAAGTRDEPDNLKFDLRTYVYDGRVQWTAARLYQGQTTNFRTPGGGFAPVYPLRDEDARVEIDVIGRQADTGRACCAGQCG